MTISTSETPRPTSLEDRLRERATELGFDVCRIASATAPWPAGERLREFVAEGRHGTMRWMEETADRRVHPTAMWAEARSAVVLGMNYGPDTDPRLALADRSRGAISVYAQGDDYHELIKGRLKQLGGWMASRLGGELKVFVDTAPLMEKPLASAAGVGWQGKHTNLVSRDFGSWLFLGSILTTVELKPDPPEPTHCGTCDACLTVCPTNAFPAPFKLDARACLSYLTIEHAGPWPVRYRTAMGNRIYGCDDCLAACPWNKFAQGAREIRLQARDSARSPLLAELAALDDAGFRARFTKSPVKRIGRDRFLRNVLYAIGNSGEPSLAAVAERRLDDASPLVRGAAAWALSRLLPVEDFTALASRRLPAEANSEVQAEWRREAA
jgi:epoxyqueuosine reductase